MPSLFLSYARKDQQTTAVDSFVGRLTDLGKAARPEPFELWQDQYILPGQFWRKEIDTALQQADYGLLLISPAFLASDFIRDVEIPELYHRAVPVLLRPTPASLIKSAGLNPIQIHQPKERSFIEHKDTAAKDRFVGDLFSRLCQLHEGNGA